MLRPTKQLLLFSLLLLVQANSATAARATVAVAANFATTLQQLVTTFENTTDHQITTVTASSGKLYAQIMRDAPFDILLSADTHIPQRLITQNIAAATSYIIYANGQLAVASNRHRQQLLHRLKQGTPNKIAIANPRHAPYGQATIAALQHLGWYQANHEKFVFGQNVRQTNQYIYLGVAEIGVTSRSACEHFTACSPLPSAAYQPVAQAGVMLRRGANNPAAVAFMQYIRSPQAKDIIRRAGYIIE